MLWYTLMGGNNKLTKYERIAKRYERKNRKRCL